MKLTNKYVVLGDIHGDYRKLMKVMRNLYKKGFRLKGTHNVLVQLGDRVDRGPDSYRVNRLFLRLQKRYPAQITLIYGNHEDMMKEAATRAEHNHIFYYNGGNTTLKSYSKVTKEYGKGRLYHSLVKAGHWDLLVNNTLYLLTNKYFFCHAPIPKKEYRRGIAKLAPDSFLNCKDTLIWSFQEGKESKWVDPDPMEGRIAVYGHIHGLYEDRKLKKIVSPGVRKYGNSILLDTGCGCDEEGRLTALILPDMITINDIGIEGNGLKSI